MRPTIKKSLGRLSREPSTTPAIRLGDGPRIAKAKRSRKKKKIEQTAASNEEDEWSGLDPLEQSDEDPPPSAQTVVASSSQNPTPHTELPPRSSSPDFFALPLLSLPVGASADAATWSYQEVRAALMASPLYCQGLLARIPSVKVGWCLVSQLEPQPNGYVRVTQAGYKWNLHDLTLWAANKACGGDSEVSHLCGERRCLNIKHVVAESHDANMKRVNCPVYTACPHKTCRQMVVSCVHQPPCVRHRAGESADADEFFLRWCHDRPRHLDAV